MIGPGKYDPELTEIMKQVKPEGAILIVNGGIKGSGFSAQGNIQFHSAIPNALRQVADQIEADMRQGKL